MTNEEQRRQLLNQALLGLSPSINAKTRARARLGALGPPAAGNADSAANDDVLTKGHTAVGVHLDRTRAALLLAAGVTLGGFAGFALGSRLPHQPAVVESPHVPSQLASGHAPKNNPPQPSTLPLPHHDEPTRMDNPSSPSVPRRTNRGRAHASIDGGQIHRNGLSSPAKTHHDADEVLWIQRVRKALARGEPQVALGLLRELDVEVPVGRLAEERAAGRAIAHCMLQPTDGATEASGFAERFPNSVHLKRVSQTCHASARTPIPLDRNSKP